MHLFADRFGGYPDYFAALEAVWGPGIRRMCEDAVSQAEANAEFSLDFKRGAEPKQAGAHALLMAMPEPDFRLAVDNTARAALATDKLAPRITQVCRARGAPWSYVADAGFQWVGDEVVERELLRPAVAVLNDPRFAGGVRSEFESARNELRTGTAVARKHAVYECGCAVESAMKVLLDEREIAYDAHDTAQKLFEHLVAAGLVPHYMERTVLAPAVPRNKTAAHGAGAISHSVSIEQAEAIVAATAGSIAYLGKLLPPAPTRPSLLTRFTRRRG